METFMGDFPVLLSTYWWIPIIVCGSLALFILPWIFVWRYRGGRKQLMENGIPARASVLQTWDTGLTIGTSSSDSGGGTMRGIGLLLEVHPPNGQPYQVKTREQLHLLDLSRLTPGMTVEIRIDPKNPQRVMVSNWI